MAMARISNRPKVGEFLILKTDRTEIDLQVTSVDVRSTMDGHSTIHVEGFPHRERVVSNQGISGMGMVANNMADYVSNTYPQNGVGNYVGNGGWISTTTAQSGQGISITPSEDLLKIRKTPGKGMDVDITSIETVDGTKAQIVLYAGSKRVIAWESEAFEDDEDLSVKGAQTAEVKAKKAAEGHAKSVLKTIFSQS
jgi:hypothetical protein